MRLFSKHELALAHGKAKSLFPKVREQFEYARENIESIKRISGLDSSVMDAGGQNSFKTAFISKLFEFVKRLLYMVSAFFIFTIIFRNVRLST